MHCTAKDEDDVFDEFLRPCWHAHLIKALEMAVLCTGPSVPVHVESWVEEVFLRNRPFIKDDCFRNLKLTPLPCPLMLEGRVARNKGWQGAIGMQGASSGTCGSPSLTHVLFMNCGIWPLKRLNYEVALFRWCLKSHYHEKQRNEHIHHLKKLLPWTIYSTATSLWESCWLGNSGSPTGATLPA